MPSIYYLGETTDGRIVSRKSNRDDFTHAAKAIGDRGHSMLPNFSTSAHGAAKLFESGWREVPAYEVVELRKVSAKEYRAATDGINPRTGRPNR